MRRRAYGILGVAVAIAMLSARFAIAGQPASPAVNWQEKLKEMMPLLGHRNWILIVDSAYPLQDGTGIETVETGADEEQVVRQVLDAINRSVHVRPVVFMDAELPFVPEQDAPGVSAFRDSIRSVLGATQVTQAPHEQMLARIHETGKDYQILVLKTNETIPYTSVFLQLNCKYWSDDAESRLRQAMKASHPNQQ
jgi:D-ribose pyranose/furanose isomerase RbsD